MSSEAMPLDD